MPPYRIHVYRPVRKSLRSVPVDIQKRVAAATRALAEEPRHRGVEKLRGYEDVYRVRVGDWRLVVRIDDAEQSVTLLALGHRREIYRD